MATVYDFTTRGSGRIITFDASAAQLMETVKSTDVTTGQTFWITQVDVAVCSSVGFRLLDNSVAINRICSLPAIDNTDNLAGIVTAHWDFQNTPIKIAYTDYTRLIVESTIAGQIRGSVQMSVGV